MVVCVSVGLFTYPVLMASDILLYATDLVQIGEDQKQHLEFARDIARRFNSTYGETFKVPEPSLPNEGARIMGLDDPKRKMSKGDRKWSHAIYLLDSAEEVRSKIMSATTDSLREIRFNKKRPGMHNLLIIYQLFTGVERREIEARFVGKGYADFKRELSEVIINSLRPLQSRYRRIMSQPDCVDTALAKGAEKVRPLAEGMLKRVKRRIGLG